MASDDMDIAIKKVELIEWLSRLQDRSVIARIDALKKASAGEIHSATMPHNNDDLERKLERSEAEIKSGNTASQKEVEEYFKRKFVN